jgi:mono/diheme cytochrome c family protein
MEQFIAGNVSYKPRPWLLARMPSFPAQSQGLAVGFAHEHGFPTVASSNPAPDATLAETGKKLVAKTGGFSCIQCHDAGEMKALSAFEAPAPNFAHTTERLTHEFYMRWVLRPQKVQPGTRMPDFADAEGKTSLKTFYDGDGRQQFEAIWNFLLTAPNLQPPQ